MNHLGNILDNSALEKASHFKAMCMTSGIYVGIENLNSKHMFLKLLKFLF